LFPASWLRLESQLRAMSSRKPFMKWDEFVNASQSCSIDDADIVEVRDVTLSHDDLCLLTCECTCV